MGVKNPKIEELVRFVIDHPDQFTYKEIARRFNLTFDQVSSGIRRGRQRYTLHVKPDRPQKFHTPRTKEYIPPPPNTKNVLIIGDVHVPFDIEGYREFCAETYKKYQCTHVIFTGDIADFYAFSRYDHDPDTMNPGEEFDNTKEGIQKWYKTFPKADVLIGNHDMRIMKKAFSAGIPRRLILSYQDMFEVPGWNFREKFVYDGVRYIHGEGGNARSRARKDWISTVQGHLHLDAYVEHIQGENSRIFACQIGCGVDMDAYAFDYAKHHKRPVIGVGVILDHGRLPINIIM